MCVCVLLFTEVPNVFVGRGRVQRMIRGIATVRKPCSILSSYVCHRGRISLAVTFLELKVVFVLMKELHTYSVLGSA